MLTAVRPRAGGSALEVDAPSRLFADGLPTSFDAMRRSYDVMPDGTRLIAVVQAQAAVVPPIRLIVNWRARDSVAP